ncbi:DsbA family protein [Cryobacterium sp. 1639]|uniref:DsbA family protein n=1 Tax=Cryobacterium inferilacus TaxID=2866629 RepID=UPI001C73389B|nr:thioredoxin domain-containing protein [Cryobacterium sp. 1639]MBX0301416.1 DsbA family protein [Cryobacterium sp. 1639]
MKTITKINLGVGAAVLIAVAAVIAVAAQPAAAPKGTSAAAPTSVLEENTHRLDVAPDGKVTLVEFLDFECEVCGAVYPYIEQAREDYAGRVTFATRYFPIPGHRNSQTSAVAVEAAAQQDEFEAMYNKMFQTQASWGESQESKADLFRTYAEELGLDMAQYDADVADRATVERVQSDFDAGRELGVEGTPTIFVNDEKILLENPEDITAALDAALAQ